ncbi:MAG TPA: 3-hydroxyacyl-CoA dehydrogenase NAD-binding domain-containing protein [Stellaceae bacterium]|nr:3-hydroxyacyl-CoA dehydrogenase NAD-binding domain-containing protein [Stellaceae bacterium]
MIKTGSHVLAAIKGDRLELGHGQPVAGTAGYRCWRRLREADGIEWLILDQTDASTNRIEPAMLEELDAVLAEIERDRPPGLVIRSAKRNGFVAGADIAQFRGVGDAGAMASVLGRGHAVFDRLAALPVPAVAVVHGFCLGGGLELALACQRRIALPDASLGFPEVQLGLHPGLGGTARLTRLIDPLDAMSMMLTGRPKNARAALRAGLVDALTEERHVAAAVRAAISGALKPRRPWFKTAAFITLPVRRLAGSRMRAAAQKRARPEHYPAPAALIDLWEKHGGGESALKAAEIPSFSNLLVGETAQNLIRIFFLRQAMGKADKSAHAVRHVHVIGAGAMGGDIAAWCAYKGLRVTLADMSLKALGGAMKRAGDLFAYHYRDRHDRAKLRDAFDRLIPDPKGVGVGGADLIIEAVPENLDLKRKIFAGLEPKMKPGAILATNTSSIRIEDLRQGLQHPERLVGIHFFNPVSRMPLIEVVSHDQAAPEALASARAFAARIDRVAAPVKSAPGFPSTARSCPTCSKRCC